ncbi:MAG: hypothetical protein DI603_19555 [Roseateles depolymerans]|uniref:Uncharacterized protein n=1 Tax=Roseateles depolymerans TaxID=76731 RepID=A0A2W5FBE9_9BURK|nr:MAG: hypothetical protein DI603_19555 [Roseateles depolymerans]
METVESDDTGPETAGEADLALDWMLPGARSPAADALRRIQCVCGGHPELFNAMFCVLATHQELPREILAVAIKQFRPDLEAYTREDVVSLLNGIWNGGKSGFEAVLRTRANSPKRGAGAFSWVKE